jgi:phosphate transport system substrate-binding protein
MSRARGILSAASLLFVGVLMLSGCGAKRTPITLAGSTAFQPFAEKLAEHYMTTHRDVRLTVQGGGSAVGIQSALSGTAQIGMADLVKLPPEAASLTSLVVARDGIAVIVHPSNPVTNLTMVQIRDIFSGKIADWKDVGGPDRRITVVSREAGSGTRSSFEQIVGEVSLMREALIQDSNGAIRETVANDAQTIGYLSHGLLNDRIKAVRVAGEECTTQAIVAGKYPLVRPIYLLTRGAPAGAAREFLDYLLTPEAQGIIEKSGLIRAR